VDPLMPDLLVCLGGPIGAYEEAAYPFLRDELALIERRLAAARPTLGICLGAQLMARALGARIYPAPAKEIGWGEVRLSEAGQKGPLRHFAGVPVLHWHGDTFDLPKGAELLASTVLCANQAFAFGRYALAFQFHPETTATVSSAGSSGMQSNSPPFRASPYQTCGAIPNASRWRVRSAVKPACASGLGQCHVDHSIGWPLCEAMRCAREKLKVNRRREY
jgi:GMP synthase-like glutamine amidotransferase